MKKTVLVLLLVLVSGWAMAQRVTYMQEGFLPERPWLQADLWDMSDDVSYKALAFSSSTSAGGEAAPEAVWGYYPDAGLSNQLEGTLRLISKPLVMQTGMRNYVSVKYVYTAKKSTTVNIRKFGLAVREGDGEWQVCKEVNSFPTAHGGLLVGELPEDMAGKSDIQMSLYYTTPKDGTYYLLYFDDITCFGYPSDDYALSYVFDGQLYSTTDILNVNLLLTNQGNRMDSCEVSYTLDGGEVQHFVVSSGGNGWFPGETKLKKGFTPEGWAEADYGVHELAFWLSKVNDVVVAADKIEKSVKYLNKIDPSDPNVKSFKFRPLMEHFSSSTCPPCATANQYMNPLAAELADTMTWIKYQIDFPGNGDPYATRESIKRRGYYNVNSVPTFVLNGKAVDLGTYGQYWNEITNGLKRTILKSAGSVAYLGLTLDTAAIDADQKIHVTVKVESVGGCDRAILHAVVLEGTTYGNASTNGETEFHNVMMKMLPDADGEFVSLKPDTTYTFSYVGNMAGTNMEEFNDLHVACFLQMENGTILQSAMKEVASYSDAPGAVVAVDYMPTYICAEDIPAGLQLTCTGGSKLTSVEVSGKVGRTGSPVVKEYTVDMDWGAMTYVAFPDLKAGSEKGSDTVFFSITKVNGQAFDGKEIARAIEVQPSDIAFKPLLEGFTSATVAGSVALNQFLDEVSETEGLVMKFPMKGDRYNRSVYTRYADKIGVANAPGLALNGHAVAVKEDGTLAYADYIASLMEQSQKNHSIFKIIPDGDITVGGNSAPGVAGVFNFEGLVDSIYHLFMMVVESETKLNAGTNGETEFKRVVQALFPDENGTTLPIRDGKGMFMLSRSITASKVENYSNLSLVVVIKNADLTEVLQTAEFPILNRVPNEGLAAYGNLEVYPNPTSDYVYLNGLEDATLEVFDMAGVKIFGTRHVNGDYTLDVQGYAPGLYMIKMREDGKTSVARISVVK